MSLHIIAAKAKKYRESRPVPDPALLKAGFSSSTEVSMALRRGGIGASYVAVLPSEIIEEGDQIQAADGKWVCLEVGCWGKPIQSHWRIRRPIKRPTSYAWVMVAVGEKMKDGDQYRTTNGLWGPIPRTWVGTPVVDSTTAMVRRPMPATEVPALSYRELSVGETLITGDEARCISGRVTESCEWEPVPKAYLGFNVTSDDEARRPL